MGWIIFLTFAGVFTLIALPLISAISQSHGQSKQVMTVIDAALAGSTEVQRENILDFRKSDQLSNIPWLNRRLRDLQLGPHLRLLLDQANLKWTVGRLLTTCGVFGIVPAYLMQLRHGNPLVTLLVGVVSAFAPLAWVMHRRSRRLRLYVEQLPEALDLMVSGLRAGNSLASAIDLVGNQCPDPIGCEFKTCFEEQNYGLELNLAMDNMIKRVPVQDLKLVTSAIMIQKESGGNLAEVLDRASYTIRQRFRLKRQIRVHTAQGRMTGWVLALLPVVLGIAIYFVNPEMMSVLWKRPIGIKLLCASAGLTLVGGLVIRKIVDIDV
jgi:tight adherence protein B